MHTRAVESIAAKAAIARTVVATNNVGTRGEFATVVRSSITLIDICNKTINSNPNDMNMHMFVFSRTRGVHTRAAISITFVTALASAIVAPNGVRT